MTATGCRRAFPMAWLAGLLLPGWMLRPRPLRFPRCPVAAWHGQGAGWPRSTEQGVSRGLWQSWAARCALVRRGALDPPPWCSGRLWRTHCKPAPACPMADVWVRDSLAACEDGPLSSSLAVLTAHARLPGPPRDTGGTPALEGRLPPSPQCLHFGKVVRPSASSTASACSSH